MSGLCVRCLSRASLTPTQLLSTWDKKQRVRHTRSLQAPGAYMLVQGRGKYPENGKGCGAGQTHNQSVKVPIAKGPGGRLYVARAARGFLGFSSRQLWGEKAAPARQPALHGREDGGRKGVRAPSRPSRRVCHSFSLFADVAQTPRRAAHPAEDAPVLTGLPFRCREQHKGTGLRGSAARTTERAVRGLMRVP